MIGGEKPGLVRALTLSHAVSLVVGIIIGTGIFLVPAQMARSTGSFALVMLAWVVGGLLSLFGALTYAELSSAMPEAGGEYVYLRRAYSPLVGYLWGWSGFILARSGSMATIASGFAIFASFFFPSLGGQLAYYGISIGQHTVTVLDIHGTTLLAVAAIWTLTWVNYTGVRTGGRVQSFLTVLKVSVILGLTGLAFAIGRGSTAHFAPLLPKEFSGATWAGFFGGAMVATLWAYDGWNNLTMVGSEVARPEKDLPRALIYGTLAVGLIYIVTNVAYFYVLPLANVAASQNVAAAVATQFLGRYGAAIVILGAIISSLATLNGSTLTAARIPYAMARDGVFFRRLADVHPRYRTPSMALLIDAGMASLLALTGGFQQLYTLVIFGEWLFYALTTAGVFLLRRKEPNMARPYRTWGYPIVPGAFVAVASVLLVYTFLQNLRESLMGLGLIFAGLPLYWHWRRRSRPL